MKKRNLKKEKAVRNEAYADKFTRYDKETRKKLRHARVKTRDAEYERKYWERPVRVLSSITFFGISAVSDPLPGHEYKIIKNAS